MLDEDRIARDMALPTREEYPTAPSDLFGSHFMQPINNLIMKAKGRVRQETRGHPQGFRCTITLDFPGNDEELSAPGQGQNKKAALRAAYLHLLSKMHLAGLLKEMLPTNNKSIDSNVLKEEADAKMEVYNYAARFGLIPTVTVEKVQPRLRLTAPTQAKVTIRLPEHGIEVTARDVNLDTANIIASVKFKEAAEHYHAERGTAPISDKELLGLHADNAGHLLEFYTSRCSNRMSFDFNLKEVSGFRTRGGQVFQAQMFAHYSPSRGQHANLEMLNADFDSDSKSAVGPAVTMSTKKKAEKAAALVGAITLLGADQHLGSEFRAAVSGTGGAILPPVKPCSMDLDEDAIILMQDTLRESRQAGLGDDKEEVAPEPDFATRQVPSRYPQRRNMADPERERKSSILSARQKTFSEDASLEGLRQKKAALPMNQYRQRVAEMIGSQTYCVIIGATGSGKTTQVPQILLDQAIQNGVGANCNVVCTQPRRIAATSVARRVAEERNERLQQSVGYQVRFDSKRPEHGGSISYCTTGVLLQQLQAAPDDTLDQLSHIVIDEVHERDILIDFLMILVKNAINMRQSSGKPVPKVILMSATIDSKIFADYFNDGGARQCPSLDVPGRTFPVTETYLDTFLGELQHPRSAEAQRLFSLDRDTNTFLQLERSISSSGQQMANGSSPPVQAVIDWKRDPSRSTADPWSNERDDALVPIGLVAASIAQTVSKSTDGAILVFLPGYDEMKRTAEFLHRFSPLGIDFGDESKFKFHMLHSAVPASEQQEVFGTAIPGCRKIILSTNIAETSVTIPDVQYVIDTGKVREKRYDQLRRITKLQCTWISKSNAKQRAGRAGRVQNGHYIALYSQERQKLFSAVGLPEMLRSDLQEICLDIKAHGFRSSIQEFLAQAIEPPSRQAVDASVQNLKALEALTQNEDLTPLGRLLASLPVHPSLGKMIVLGVIFRCLDPMIILGATIGERPLFVAPPERRNEAQERHHLFLEDTGSDHFALINAFSQMRELCYRRGFGAMKAFAMENFLHSGAFQSIEGTGTQIVGVLTEAGLIPGAMNDNSDKFGHASLNENAHDLTLIKALTLAGLHPNLAVGTKKPLFRTPMENNVLIHPSSLNSRKQSKKNEDESSGAGMLYSYSTLAKSSDGKSVLMKDTTCVTPLLAVLFGGRLRWQDKTVEMDGWLPFSLYATRWEMKMLMEFRKALDRLLTNTFGELAKFRNGKAASEDEDEGGGKYLADDRIRRIFAEGLVEVLRRDMTRPSRRVRHWQTTSTGEDPDERAMRTMKALRELALSQMDSRANGHASKSADPI